MIYKILLLIAVIAAVYFFFFKTKPVAKKRDEKAETKKIEGDETVECVTCGTYVALDDAIISNGKYYCSQECLKG